MQRKGTTQVRSTQPLTRASSRHGAHTVKRLTLNPDRPKTLNSCDLQLCVLGNRALTLHFIPLHTQFIVHYG